MYSCDDIMIKKVLKCYITVPETIKLLYNKNYYIITLLEVESMFINIYYYYYYYYYRFSSGNRSMAILEDRQSRYIHILYHTSKLHTSVVVMVAQRIRPARVSVICVARLTTPRYIWVESQGLIKFILKIHNIFSGNIPDTWEASSTDYMQSSRKSYL